MEALRPQLMARTCPQGVGGPDEAGMWGRGDSLTSVIVPEVPGPLLPLPGPHLSLLLFLPSLPQALLR